MRSKRKQKLLVLILAAYCSGTWSFAQGDSAIFLGRLSISFNSSAFNINSIDGKVESGGSLNNFVNAAFPYRYLPAGLYDLSLRPKNNFSISVLFRNRRTIHSLSFGYNGGPRYYGGSPGAELAFHARYQWSAAYDYSWSLFPEWEKKSGVLLLSFFRAGIARTFYNVNYHSGDSFGWINSDMRLDSKKFFSQFGFRLMSVQRPWFIRFGPVLNLFSIADENYYCSRRSGYQSTSGPVQNEELVSHHAVYVHSPLSLIRANLWYDSLELGMGFTF